MIRHRMGTLVKRSFSPWRFISSWQHKHHKSPPCSFFYLALYSLWWVSGGYGPCILRISVKGLLYRVWAPGDGMICLLAYTKLEAQREMKLMGSNNPTELATLTPTKNINSHFLMQLIQREQVPRQHHTTSIKNVLPAQCWLKNLCRAC